MSTRYERMLEAIANGEQITDEPICRREMFLKALANNEGASNLPDPICREEEFYKAIIQGETITAEPICKREEYLKAIANKEDLPECSNLNCREQALLSKVCIKTTGGGGSTPSETTYTVTFGTGVTVLSGSTSITSGTKVTSGTSLKVSYTLSDNYHLVSFKVNGTEVANNSTITVTSNVTITFTQEIDTYAVTFNDGVSVLNGETSLTSGDKVPYGTSLIVGYILSENYHLTAFKVNEVDTTNNSTITVTEDINIIFTQEINTYAVTFSTGVSVLNNGVAISSGEQVAYGTSLVVSYILTDGYKLTSFQINGVDAENNTTITVTENVEIVFAEEEEVVVSDTVVEEVANETGTTLNITSTNYTETLNEQNGYTLEIGG